MSLLVAIYEQRHGFARIGWATLGLGPANFDDKGTSLALLKERTLQKLKAWVKKAKPRELATLEKLPGMTLEHHRITLVLDRFSASLQRVPLILEPRHSGAGEPLLIGYHPLQQRDFFVVDRARSIATQYRTFLETLMRDAEDIDELKDLEARKDRLRTLVFDAEIPSLLDRVGPARNAWWADLRDEAQKKKEDEDGPSSELDTIATDLTERATEEGFTIGLPREPFGARLKALVARGPVVVIGPPGVGKTTTIQRWVHERLHDDGYQIHKSLDQVRKTWSLSGRRILAGMKHHGDWEARIAKLIDELTRRRGFLYVPDLPNWSRLGKTRDSERSLSDVMRGPLERREVVIVGEATRDAWARLEEDAPAFAAQFQILTLPEPHPDEVMRMLLAAGRVLDDDPERSIDAGVYDALLEWSEVLYPGRAEPGRSLAMLAEAGKIDEHVSRWEVLDALSDRAGVDRDLLMHQARQPNYEPHALNAIGRSIFGQDEATRAMVDLLQRIRTGLSDNARPWGVFLLTGPTGTGKTELAKALAGALYDHDRLVRIDMNQLTGPDAVARLIGDAHDPNGRLTGPILESPFQVVLLDELEKAHPSALYLLLQLLDEGRLTDAAGRTADFRRAVILITSNLGAATRPSLGFGEGPSASARRNETTRAVAAALPPELFNRLDGVLAFQPLQAEVARAIAQRAVGQLAYRPGVRDRQGSLTCTPAAIDLVVSAGFDPEYGARTVKRWIESHITDPLAAALVGVPGDAFKRITIDAAAGAITIDVAALRPTLRAGAAPYAYLLDFAPADCDPSIDQLTTALAALETRSPSDIHDSDDRQLVAPVSADDADRLYWREQFRSAVAASLKTLRRMRNIRRSPARDIVEALSHGAFLLSLAPHIDEDIHRVTLHLSRPMSGASRLMAALIKAYTAAPWEREAFVRTTSAGVRATNLDGEDLGVVVLQLAGLGARKAFAHEVGAHVLDAMAGGLDVVNVTALPTDVPLDAHLTHTPVLSHQVRALRHEAGKEARPYFAHDLRTGHEESGHIAELADLITWLMQLTSAEAPS